MRALGTWLYEMAVLAVCMLLAVALGIAWHLVGRDEWTD